MDLNKHVGRDVVMIYEDRHRNLTQRYVTIRSVCGDDLKVFDQGKGEPRSLHVSRVLSALPVKRYE